MNVLPEWTAQMLVMNQQNALTLLAHMNAHVLQDRNQRIGLYLMIQFTGPLIQMTGYIGNGKTDCQLKPCPAGQMGSGLSCHPLPSHAVLVPGGTAPSGWLINEPNFIFNILGDRKRNPLCTTVPGCGPYVGTTYDCMGGFQSASNEFKCDDIDECAPGGVANCHSNAHCVNKKGSFACYCNAGYLGDGVTKCEKVGCPSDQFGVPPNCKVISIF